MEKNKKAPARHKAEDDYLLTTKLFCEYCGAYLCGESGTCLLYTSPYCEARLKANHDYANRDEFARKCLMNIANACEFSSDRTIRQYAEEIWHITAEYQTPLRRIQKPA